MEKYQYLAKVFIKKSESGVLRLIRTSCKAFSFNGDAKSGCHVPFMTFIKDYFKENGMHSFPLTNFKGNRFNILFHNAGIVYFFHEKIKLFFKTMVQTSGFYMTLKSKFLSLGVRHLVLYANVLLLLCGI